MAVASVVVVLAVPVLVLMPVLLLLPLLSLSATAAAAAATAATQLLQLLLLLLLLLLLSYYWNFRALIAFTLAFRQVFWISQLVHVARILFVGFKLSHSFLKSEVGVGPVVGRGVGSGVPS